MHYYIVPNKYNLETFLVFLQDENSFKIRFRGIRGSYPTPKKDFLTFGGNTACVEVHCGNQLIILDAGSGIIELGLDEIKNNSSNENKKPYQSTIILSHIHQDHIQGLQFYKPLFKNKSAIKILDCKFNENSNFAEYLVLFDDNSEIWIYCYIIDNDNSFDQLIKKFNLNHPNFT